MDNNVNNKYMLDALLNAVGISDDVINKQNEDDMKAKKKKMPIIVSHLFSHQIHLIVYYQHQQTTI